MLIGTLRCIRRELVGTERSLGQTGKINRRIDTEMVDGCGMNEYTDLWMDGRLDARWTVESKQIRVCLNAQIK